MFESNNKLIINMDFIIERRLCAFLFKWRKYIKLEKCDKTDVVWEHFLINEKKFIDKMVENLAKQKYSKP